LWTHIWLHATEEGKDEMSETIVNDVLRGKINVDYEGAIRWRYIASVDDTPQYMCQKEFADLFINLNDRISAACGEWQEKIDERNYRLKQSEN
jgi:hypothetical protein